MLTINEAFQLCHIFVTLLYPICKLKEEDVGVVSHYANYQGH